MKIDKEMMLTCILFVIFFWVGCGEVGLEVLCCDLDKEMILVWRLPVSDDGD